MKNLYHVMLDDVKKNSRASMFSRGFNKENENVNLKILDGFLKRMKELENNPMTGGFSLTLTILKEVAEISLTDSINEISFEIKKFYGLSLEEQEERELIRAKQKKNFFKELSNLSVEEKFLYSILELIENLKVSDSIPKRDIIPSFNDFE